MMDILARTLMAALLCGLAIAFIWQLPLSSRFQRLSSLGLTVTPFAAALRLIFGF